MYWVRRIAGKLGHLYCEARAKGRPVRGRILMIHDVGGPDAGAFNLRTEDFEDFLRRRRNYIRLEDWKETEGYCAMTADDVPEGFYRNGFPLLKKYNVPFTVFVSLELLDREGYITSEQLREMASCELCTVGSHGLYHGEYARLSEEAAARELSESCRKLGELTGRSVTMYAFPYGSLYACGYRRKSLVKKYYRYGFGTVQIPVTDPAVLPDYFIPRINLSESNIKTL